MKTFKNKFTNTDKFCKTAIFYEENNRYTDLIPGTKEYWDFWDEEKRRCLEGIEIDGVRITGYHYFYLNFFRIDRAVDQTINGRKIRVREYARPRFYDGDYEFFWLCEIARNGISVENYEKLGLSVDIHEDDLAGGKQLVVLKARRKGYSYKTASMLTRNYYFVNRSKNFVFAFDKKYLEGDGMYQKFLDGVGFIDANTPFIQPVLIDRPAQMLVKNGYTINKDGRDIEKGKQAMVQGVSLKDNPDGVRGNAGELNLFEEMGKFPKLKMAWNIAKHTVAEGTDILGLMVAFGTGGCLTAGNKVWNNKGELVNIEDLDPKDGIIGYNQKLKKVSKESISYWQKPKYKECIKLTTNTRRTIECSLDHPIYTVDYTSSWKANKHYFKEACDFNIGDKIAIADKVDIFGSNKMWNPYLVGLLIGDGSYGYNGTVTLSNADQNVKDYIKSNFKYHTSIQRPTKDGRIYEEINIKEIRPYLKEIGILNQTKLDKTLPKNVHQYCKKDIVELLSGFFDADGYVNIRKNKKRDSWIAEISLSSMSEKLLNEVRFLLQKFGIHGRMRERLPRKNRKGKIQDKNPWYEFTIADKKSLTSFAENINLKCRTKKERLEIIKKEFKNVSTHSVEKGIRLEKITKIEYIGLKRVYNLTADITNTYLGNGIVTHNTAGADFEGAEKLFYEPENNGCLRIHNKWDAGAEGTYSGYFVPVYRNLPGFMDEDGNSLEKEAIDYENGQREKQRKAKDSDGYTQHVAELPFNPREAILAFDVNILPTQQLLEQRNIVEVHKKWQLGTPGHLIRTEKGIKFKPDLGLKPILKFPHTKQDDLKGCPIVYEAPVRVNDEIPKDLYIACHDPYAKDEVANAVSLGVTYIIKRTNEFSPTLNECIVASYVGRPESQDEYNRNLFMLLEYYNAKLGFENDRGDVIGYARRHKKLHMLEKQFTFMDKKELQGKSKTAYGMNMTKERKEQGEIYLRDWLLSTVQTFEDGKKSLILHTIVDPALLTELMKFTMGGNFDRVMSLIVGMFHRQEVYNKKVKEIRENKHDEFFNRFA